MKLHRFIGKFDLSQKSIILSDPLMMRQIINVLRLRVGDNLVVCDGKGFEAQCTIEDMLHKSIQLHVGKRERSIKEYPQETTLYCSLLKRENTEVVVQKATEIGVSGIVFFRSQRTIKESFNQKRLETIAREAAEQSGRGIVPDIFDAGTFQQAIRGALQKKLKVLFCDSSGGVLDDVRDKKTAFFIGPEGGWSDEERSIAQEKKFTIIHLGRFTLRAETAALCAVFAITSLCNSLSR